MADAFGQASRSPRRVQQAPVSSGRRKKEDPPTLSTGCCVSTRFSRGARPQIHGDANRRRILPPALSLRRDRQQGGYSRRFPPETMAQDLWLPVSNESIALLEKHCRTKQRIRC